MTLVDISNLLGYVVLSGLGLFLLAALAVTLYIAFYDVVHDARLAFNRKFNRNVR